MRSIIKIFILCLSLIMFFAFTSYSSEAKVETKSDKKITLKSPLVFFPQPKFEFPEVLEGNKVTHDFVIMNKGTDILKVEKVKSGWGCTTVSYSREIPPGEEGKITIKVNTKGYGGRKLKKTITILTNDKAKPDSKLYISGAIEKFATIEPRVIRFNGKIGDLLEASVKIVPESKYPFLITGVSAQKGTNIKYVLEEAKIEENKTGDVKTYTLKVQNLKKDAGFYKDVLILKTDSKIQPEIKIQLMARIVDPNSKKKDLPGSAKNGKGQNNFLELIQKMQKQKQADGGSSAAPTQDPAKAEELKKKFEALIKQAQEKNKAKQAQPVE